MPLEEAAADEIEAMEAIMCDSFWREPESDAFTLRVTPGCDESSETAGTLGLAVEMPSLYPSSAAASFTILSVDELGTRCPALGGGGGGSEWMPSDSQRAAVEAAVTAATAERPGEPVVFDAVEAIRQWLEANTISAKPAALGEGVDGAAEESEDDMELDDEDLDGEMIEALRPVLRGDGKRLKALEEAAELKDGSAAQRTALKAIWRSLTDAQKAQMVESSDEEEEQPARGKKGGGGGQAKGGGGGQPPAAAKRECPKGHPLTPVNSKPADYAKLDGNEFNCDVCDRDGKYTCGAYHCATCRNWDCCVTCGSKPTGGATSGSSKGKKGKPKR